MKYAREVLSRICDKLKDSSDESVVLVRNDLKDLLEYVREDIRVFDLESKNFRLEKELIKVKNLSISALILSIGAIVSVWVQLICK